MNKRYAAIDIGTNTILMLIAEIKPPRSINVIVDEHRIARLGEGIAESKIINEKSVKRACKILTEYRKILNTLNVNNIKAVATSAMREAENQDEVRKKLTDALKENIIIINPEKEAFYSYIGAVDDKQKNLVIDIGGGSTEIISGNNLNIEKLVSLKTGAVKITENFLGNAPVDNQSLKKAKNHIFNLLNKINFKYNHEKVYAVAGTPTTLAAIAVGLNDYDGQKIHGFKLYKSKITEIYNLLKIMTVDEIIQKLKVNPHRADVILAGIIILLEILDYLDTDSCIASTKGLRYGVIKNMIYK
jgi:exopolyphosphatase / guanosine-5'-triphosphate,3'-diphosphate pyrophosphatase